VTDDHLSAIIAASSSGFLEDDADQPCQEHFHEKVLAQKFGDNRCQRLWADRYADVRPP
jgi:hypothetical protein